MTQRRRAFLTPNTPPEDLLCRSFSIPNEAVWLGTFMGALMSLAEEVNWEKFGTLTPEEAAEAYSNILASALPGNVGDCVSCVLPGGSPLFRLGRFGRIEQLVGDEWVEPEGDYALPPTPAREEATADERKCLAAANAANVLETLYEEISDAYNEATSFEEWTIALAAIIITVMGSVFGLVILPLIAIAGLIIGVIYEVLEFVGADVWTTEFTDMLLCMLYECADDTDDVVTFDMNCFMEKLANSVDLFDPTIGEIRLFGQLSLILQFLGAQSLDAMGATTEVATADCSACSEAFCVEYHFDEEDWDWTDAECYPSTLITECGWQRTSSPSGLVGIRFEFPTTTVESVGIRLSIPMDGNYRKWFICVNGQLCYDAIFEVDMGGEINNTFNIPTPEATTVIEVLVQNGTPNTSYDWDGCIEVVSLIGYGERPPGGIDC